MSFFLTPPKNTKLVSQLTGVLSNADINQVLSYVSTQSVSNGLVGGGAGGRENLEIRRSKTFFFPTNDDTKWLYNKIAQIINDTNHRIFNFTLTALQNIQYTEYHSIDNGVYHDHLDWMCNVIYPRKLSMSIQLTDGTEYQGGDLEIKLSSQNPIKASRVKGDALVFPSFLLHGVTPVTYGIRKSLVVWVEGPEWK